MEGEINRFEQALRTEFDTLQKKKSSNLTKAWKISSNHIKIIKKLQVSLADKNLGSMVVNMDDYVKATMADHHLSDRKTKEIISKEEAQYYLVEDDSAF